jgi:hypothetical protein
MGRRNSALEYVVDTPSSAEIASILRSMTVVLILVITKMDWPVLPWMM